MSSEIDDAVAALGPFLQSAESLLQEVLHPHIIPTSSPHPCPILGPPRSPSLCSSPPWAPWLSCSVRLRC